MASRGKLVACHYSMWHDDGKQWWTHAQTKVKTQATTTSESKQKNKKGEGVRQKKDINTTMQVIRNNKNY